MEQVFLNSPEDLADMMYEDASDGKTVYAVLFYEQAIDLMKSILDYGDVDLCDIEIAPGDVNGYYHEYYVVVDSEMVMHVQPAWHERNEYSCEGYYDFDADIVYIDGEASSSILRSQDMNNCYKIVWEEDDDDCYMPGGVPLTVSALAFIGIE